MKYVQKHHLRFENLVANELKVKKKKKKKEEEKKQNKKQKREQML